MKFPLQVGKEILLKSIIQAIPTYNIGLFKALKAFVKEINRVIDSFSNVFFQV